MSTTYVINALVKSVAEETKVVRALKKGDETIFEKVSLGWYLLLDGNHEKLFIGWEPLEDLKPGDKVKITITKEGQDG